MTWQLAGPFQAHDVKLCSSTIWRGTGETIVTTGFDDNMRVWDLNALKTSEKLTALVEIELKEGVARAKRMGRRLVTMSRHSRPLEESDGLTTGPSFSVQLWDLDRIVGGEKKV